MDKITLEGMQFYGYHGVFPEEQTLGQRFKIDVVLYLNLSEAGRGDELSKTVNYAEIYELVREITEQRRFRLIEALAENIASAILDAYTKIKELTVKVVKPHPPVPVQFDGVRVEIHRKRG